MFWITPNFPLSLERSIYAKEPSICRMHTHERKKNTHTKKILDIFWETCINQLRKTQKKTVSEIEWTGLREHERKRKKEKKTHTNEYHRIYIKLSECFLHDSSTVRCDFWRKKNPNSLTQAIFFCIEATNPKWIAIHLSWERCAHNAESGFMCISVLCILCIHNQFELHIQRLFDEKCWPRFKWIVSK